MPRLSKRGYPGPGVPTVAPGPTLGEVRTRGWGHYRDALLIVLACSWQERVLRTPSRPWHLLPCSGTRALSAGQRRCRLRVWNQAKRLHGSCTAQGASITSPDRALGDRGEWSPPERATGVDLKRPWRAVSAGAGHRSGLGVLPSILRDMLPDLVVGHRKPSLILERSTDL